MKEHTGSFDRRAASVLPRIVDESPTSNSTKLVLNKPASVLSHLQIAPQPHNTKYATQFADQTFESFDVRNVNK